jgi:hypothetical protein
MTQSPDQPPRGAKVKRIRRTRLRLGVPIASIWLCIWVVISIALIDIAIGQFGSDHNYLTLGSWLAGIAVGYFFFILILIRTKHRNTNRS